MTSPLYEHDCEECEYLGVDVSHPGEPKCNGVDLYVHRSDRTVLIRRYSSEGSNYGCQQAEHACSRYDEAKKRAGL